MKGADNQESLNSKKCAGKIVTQGVNRLRITFFL